MVKRITRTRPDEAIELSPEASALVADVRSEMERWIDHSVSRLQEEIGEEISQVTKDLSAHVDDVAEEFKAAREKVDKILDNIENLSNSLESGDGQTIAAAIKETMNTVVGVRAELKAREEKWKGFGKGIINTGLNAVSSILKVPFVS